LKPLIILLLIVSTLLFLSGLVLAVYCLPYGSTVNVWSIENKMINVVWPLRRLGELLMLPATFMFTFTIMLVAAEKYGEKST